MASAVDGRDFWLSAMQAPGARRVVYHSSFYYKCPCVVLDTNSELLGGKPAYIICRSKRDTVLLANVDNYKMKMAVVWKVPSPCGVVDTNRHFRAAY